MKLALLTSNHVRHKFFASRLAKYHDVVLVAAEEKGNESQYVGATPEDTRTLADHFNERDDAEKRIFGKAQFPSCEFLDLKRGQLNDSSVLDALSQSGAAGVAVFGCGLLRDDIINRFRGRLLNAHQGLSPYYRGSGTNFWPFANDELQFVGVTVHHIDIGIDTGAIVCHGRPTFLPDDGMHDVGCRVVDISADLIGRCFRTIEDGGTLQGFPQWCKGKLYQRKNFSAAAVRQAKQHIANGSIRRYSQAAAEGRAPLVQWIALT